MCAVTVGEDLVLPVGWGGAKLDVHHGGGVVGLHDLGWDSIFQEWQRARGANQWKEGPKEGPPWRPGPAQAPALLCTVLLNQ